MISRPKAWNVRAPHRGHRLRPFAGDPLGHLARRLIRKGQQQDAPRIDAHLQQALTADQRFAFCPCPTRFEQISLSRCAAAACNGFSGRSSCVAAVAGGTGGSSKASRPCRATTSNGAPSLAAMADAASPSSTWSARATMPGKQQLAGEALHLDLAPLPAAIIDNAIHSDRRRLRRRGSDRSSALPRHQDRCRIDGGRGIRPQRSPRDLRSRR